MRDCWYGDKRDLVKWASLVFLAGRHRVARILQVAFYRPEVDSFRLEIGRAEADFPPEIIQHFRKLERIEKLPLARTKIEVFKELFGNHPKSRPSQAARHHYFTRLISRVRSLRQARLIVFLDPDTGLAPRRKPSEKHVSPDEVRRVFEALKPGDWLAFYQHSHRKRTWRTVRRREFSRAARVREARVRTCQCLDVAPDVALFLVEKSGAQ